MAVLAAFVFALLMVVLVIDLVRRKKLREKYAVLWLVVGTGALILAGFPQLLAIVAGVLGVQVPANLLFAMSIVLLIGVCLHLSWELSLVEDETRVLAEETAILRSSLEDLQERMDRLDGPPPRRRVRVPPIPSVLPGSAHPSALHNDR
jgi:hypothetical protein